jgi:molecular chaperone GrpE
VDLFTLVAQFTALRHEVNLQTKAARAAVEQTAEALKLASQPKAADPGEAVRPLVKTLVDVADALQIGLRQAEKTRAAVEGLLTAPPARPGLLARLLGATDVAARPAEPQARAMLAGVADGYALSLRRIDRALPPFGLEPVECVGRPFDPDLMEVVEVVEAADQPSGRVVEEVRRGYRWNGKPFRFAQVKVAR